MFLLLTYVTVTYSVYIMLNACMPSRLVSLTLNFQHTHNKSELNSVM